MKRLLSLAILVAIIALSLSSTAYATGILLVDRGLPTANLNNAAGPLRSNVAWADWESTATPPQYWLPGDDFTISGGGLYNIDTISVWAVGPDANGLTLWGGLEGSTMAQVSSSPTTTVSMYSDGTIYQGGSGAYLGLHRVDFAVNLFLAGGQTYQFFVDGPWKTSGNGYVNTYLHASNAALSGSTQQGADGLFLWMENNGSVGSWISGPAPGGGSLGWGPGWDKASDANVEVYGNRVVPDGGATLALLGGALMGLGALRRKFRA